MDDSTPLIEEGAMELMEAFMSALATRDDAKVLAVHRTANASQDAYLAAWFLMSSKARTAIVLALERAKHPHVQREARDG